VSRKCNAIVYESMRKESDSKAECLEAQRQMLKLILIGDT